MNAAYCECGKYLGRGLGHTKCTVCKKAKGNAERLTAYRAWLRTDQRVAFDKWHAASGAT